MAPDVRVSAQSALLMSARCRTTSSNRGSSKRSTAWWPASTRPGAGRWQGRSWPRPSSSTAAKIPKGLNDSKQLSAERRDELYLAHHVQRACRRRRRSQCRRDRPDQHPPGDAYGDGARRAGAARSSRPSRWSTATTRRRCPARATRSSRATRSPSRSPPPRSSPRSRATG